MIDTGLKDRVVLITGAQHGIGAATAKAFAAQGAAVVIHYFRPTEKRERVGAQQADATGGPGRTLYAARQSMTADEVVRAIRDDGGRAHALEADLSRPESVPLLFDEAENALGAVDVLVNNAAHWDADSFLPGERQPVNPYVELWTDRPARLTAESHDRHFSVNCRAVALMMADTCAGIWRGARAGAASSTSQLPEPTAFPEKVSYGASKAGMEAYSRSAAWELGKFGITVNIVSPGPTQTGWITPELEKEILPRIPLGRLGQAEQIADVIVFLSSEPSALVHRADGERGRRRGFVG